MKDLYSPAYLVPVTFDVNIVLGERHASSCGNRSA